MFFFRQAYMFQLYFSFSVFLFACVSQVSAAAAASLFLEGGEEGGEDALCSAGEGAGSKPLPEGEMGGTTSPSLTGGGVCW